MANTMSRLEACILLISLIAVLSAGIVIKIASYLPVATDDVAIFWLIGAIGGFAAGVITARAKDKHVE